MTDKTASAVPYANQVEICGRVSADPVQRTLPSGDTLTTFRLIVDRSRRARKRSKVKVDTFDCVAWTAAQQHAAARLSAGDVVAVNGELHRRFQRGPGGPSSRIDIEVLRCRRLA
ncbi:MAG: single-stranded DNA-binding protein [Nocardioidaceae bacterium]|jgi:single-strand DNA-binding protein